MKFSCSPVLWSMVYALSGVSVIAQPLPTFNVNPPADADHASNGSKGPERQDCPTLANALMPIVPNYSPADELEPRSRYGWSTPHQPTIWFYLPYETELIAAADFSVWRRDNSTEPTLVYEAIIEQPQQGFFSIVLDDQSQPLSADTLYEVSVYVEAYCDTRSPIVESSASALIKVVEVEAEAPAAELPVAAQVANYLDRTLWYDAVNLQLQQYCDDKHSTALQGLLAAALGASFTVPEQAECTTATVPRE